jgi:hypothetical protein
MDCREARPFTGHLVLKAQDVLLSLCYPSGSARHFSLQLRHFEDRQRLSLMDEIADIDIDMSDIT